jgi:hypothetical protein
MSGAWLDCPDPPDSDPAWEYTDADEEAEWLEEQEEEERERERLAEEAEDEDALR